MKAERMALVVLMASTLGLTPAVFSAEAPAKTPVVGPTHSAAAPTLATLVAQGTIKSLDLKVTPSSLTLTLPSGQERTVWFNPKTTSVRRGAQALSAEQLTRGERVKVRYLVKNGKSLAKSIEVV